MKKKGQITKNDSGMMNSEVYHFTTFPGTATSCKLSEAKSRFAGRQAASYKLRALCALAKISDPDAFLFEMGSGWTEKGARLKNARINKINKLSFEDFEKGPSWTEKGAKLLPKRTLVILKVLIICFLPVKIEQMKQILSFGSRDKLRELYLNPLRKEGLIEITIRDKPNSPEQKYRTTEKGRLFLGGFEIN